MLMVNDIRGAFSGSASDEVIGYGEAKPINAEILPGISAAWHIVMVVPGQERIAAGHLIGRRFGVYLPEIGRDEVKRGRVRKITRPMFPGYLFVFVWGIQQHRDRIVACPGVHAIMQIDGRYAVISDGLIDHVRAIENVENPLTMSVEVFSKPKKRQRGYRKTVQKMREEVIADTQIIAVRTWSVFLDGIGALDDTGRNQALHRALGLPS